MNIKRILGCVVLGLAALRGTTIQAEQAEQAEGARVGHGNALIKDCVAAVAVMDGQTNSNVLISEFFVHATACTNYIMGFRDMGDVMDIMLRHQKLDFHPWCIGPEIPNGQLIRVVLKYLQEHPERLSEPDSNLVAYALSAAFPCQDAKKTDATPK